MRTPAYFCVIATCLLSAPLLTACGDAEEVAASVESNDAAGGSGGTEAPEPEGGAGGVATPGPTVCPDATGVYEVEPAQSNLLFLVDRSGSMHLNVSGEDTRWTLTKAGLFSIFDSLPGYTHTAVSMFPWGDAPITCCEITSSNYITCGGCAAGELPGPALRCDATQYHQLPVSMAALDELQLEKMKAQVSTADDEFYWGTPLAPALEGAVGSLVAQGSPGVSSVILLTDGKPTSCDTSEDPDANNIQLAVDAAAGGLSQAVRTYVLGVIDGDKAADAGNLSNIAKAGGTARYADCEAADDCAYSINVDNFSVDLHAALESIALEAISCSFDVPSVQGGQPDFDTVNITITSNGETTTVARDANHEEGWDYLAGNKQVQLYGGACEQLKSDVDAKVEVVIGCQTVDR